jgi:hypothetical protein
MAAETESLLIKPISVRQFELYAMSLERGPNFDPASIFNHGKSPIDQPTSD